MKFDSQKSTSSRSNLYQKYLRSMSMIWVLGTLACTTTGGGGAKSLKDRKELPPPPPLTQETSNYDLISLGIEYGGDTLAQAKKELKKRQAAAEAQKELLPMLLDSSQNLADHQLLNAANLYGSLTTTLDLNLFKTLIESDRLLARRVGWQLAAKLPDPKLAVLMDRSLSKALLEDRLEMVLIPQMANAVRSNRLKAAYTVVRQGLLTQGDEEYVLAMISLDPSKASEDFLQYLLLAPSEELRQITVSSVKIYSVMTILSHMKNFPPPISTPGFDHLFAYMISRNSGIAELARAVLEKYLPASASSLAIGLGRKPQWIQVAVLESVRREKSPGLLVLLSELKNTTADQLIAKDIEGIQD